MRRKKAMYSWVVASILTMVLAPVTVVVARAQFPHSASTVASSAQTSAVQLASQSVVATQTTVPTVTRSYKDDGKTYTISSSSSSSSYGDGN